MRFRSGVLALGATASASLAILQCSAFDPSGVGPSTDAGVEDAVTPEAAANAADAADAGPKCSGQLADDFNRQVVFFQPPWTSYESVFHDGSAGGAAIEVIDGGGSAFTIFVPRFDGDAGVDAGDAGPSLADQGAGATLVANLEGAMSEVDVDFALQLGHDEGTSWYAVFVEVVVVEPSGVAERASAIFFNGDFGLNAQTDDGGNPVNDQFTGLTLPPDNETINHLRLTATLGPSGKATLSLNGGKNVEAPFASVLGGPVLLRLGLFANGTAPTIFARYTSVNACWR